MQITTVSRPQLSVAPQEAGAKGIKLPAGGTLECEVASVKGNTAELSFGGGRTVTARMDANLKLSPGDKLTLTVSEGQGAQASLRLDSVNGQELTPKSTALEAMLLNSTSQLSTARMTGAQLMCQLGLPVTDAALGAYENAAAKFPDVSKTLLAFMAAEDMPATQENVDTLTSWVCRDLNASDVLGDFEQIVLAEDRNAAGANAAVSRMLRNSVTTEKADMLGVDFFDGFTAQLSQETVKTATSSPALRQAITQLLSDPPADSFKVISALIKAMPQELSPMEKSELALALTHTIRQTPLAKQAVASVKADTLLSELAQTLEDSVKNGESLFARLRAGSPEINASKLRKAINEMPAMLKAIAYKAEKSETPGARTLAADAEQLFSQSKAGADVPGYLYMQLPFSVNDTQNSAQLYVMKRNGKGGEIDPENATVVLSLTTENLGQVDTILRVERGSIGLNFKVDSVRTRELFKNNLNVLKALMQQTDYSLGNVQVALAEEPVTPLSVISVARQGSGLPSSGLNIMV